MKRISVLISLVLIAICLAGCGKDAAQAQPRIDVAAAKLTVAPLDGLAAFATEQPEIAPVVDYDSQMKAFDQPLPSKQIQTPFSDKTQKATYAYTKRSWGNRLLDLFDTEDGGSIRINRDTQQILQCRLPTVQKTGEKTILSNEALQEKAIAYVEQMIPGFTYDDIEVKNAQLYYSIRFIQKYAGERSNSSIWALLHYDGSLYSILANDYGCMDGLREAEFDKAALDKRLDAHMKERFSDCGMSYEMKDSYFTPDIQNERLLYYYRISVTTWPQGHPDSSVSAPYQVYFDVGAIADFKAQ